jgi:Golgi to ER traffic protein 4
MAMKRRAAAAKREVNLEEMVSSGPSGAYEALQLYRSKAIRLKSKGDINGALSSTASGAACLIKNSYITAGAELATMLVDMLDESSKELTPEVRELINQVDDSFPPKCPQQVEFLKNCVKWTINMGNRENGDPQLHLRLANSMWAMGEKNAISHFTSGEAPEELAARLQDSYGSNDQVELKIRGLTLGVLHFLALENLRDANELLDSFKRLHKEKNGDLPKSDLLTFLGYLLETCRRDAQPLFKQLVNTYASSLDFDETAGALLTGPIGHRLFGIQPKVNPMMSMLQNMLS